MTQKPTGSLTLSLRQDALPGVCIALALVGLAVALTDQTPQIPASPAFWGIVTLFTTPVVWWAASRFEHWSGELFGAYALLVATTAWLWVPVPGMRFAYVAAIAAASLVGGWRATLSVALGASLLLVRSFGATRAVWSQPALWVALGVHWLVAYLLLLRHRSERTMLDWAWQGYHESRQHLEQARSRQVELQHALEDLELANREATRLNDMLVASRQAVEDARMTKEAFVANVSHELRTPLNMIIGFSDEILERPDAYASSLPSDLLEDVSAIRRNSEHLASLVDDILDLSEAETGHMRLLYDTVDIRSVIGEAAQQVQLLFDRKSLWLRTRLPDEMPDIPCDPDRIRQVIINLLSNAGRFTDRGGAAVRCEVQDDMVSISVTDTGSGVASDVVARLFEPFQQADPSIRRQHGGTGLGLAISKQLIEMHGGEIWMTSRLNRGSTVTFTLPLALPLAPDPSQRWFSPYVASSTRDRRSQAPPVEAKPGLAIVEEGEILSQIAERHLTGLEPMRRDSLAGARALVDEGSAVGVLVNASSFERGDTSKQLARMRFDVPILNCWMPDIYGQGRTMNIREYLVKPILRGQMIETIQRIAPQGTKLLLADDDAEARQLFGRMLAGLEHAWRITMAADGEEAMRAMRQDPPDILLLDLIMPGKDGFAVLREKSADPTIRDIPVVLISARDPQHEPIVSDRLSVRRAAGLSGRELIQAIEALTGALKPRFGAPAEREKRSP